MKTTIFRALLILGGLMLLNVQTMNAGLANQFKNFVGHEFTSLNLQGFYLIAGIILTGLLFYVIFNYSEKNEKPIQSKVNYSGHQRRHHHHRAVIKKTA